MAADPSSATRRPPRVRLRPLLVPQEHGVHPLWAEPVLLGLLLAPSAAGALIAAAGAAAIVAQQPTTLGLADLRRGRRYPRTTVALAAGGALAAAALALLAGAAALAPARSGLGAWWFPLAVAAAPAGLQLGLDRALRGKSLAAQLSGAVALSALAASVALAGGAPAQLAWAAWAALALRSCASIPTVRTRLRRARGRPPAPAAAWAGAALLAFGTALGVALGALSLAAGAVALGMAARAGWLLRPGAPAVAPARIGMAETIVGLVWVATLAAGGLGPAT